MTECVTSGAGPVFAAPAFATSRLPISWCVSVGDVGVVVVVAGLLLRVHDLIENATPV
jgi:hypothetical protein